MEQIESRYYLSKTEQRILDEVSTEFRSGRNRLLLIPGSPSSGKSFILAAVRGHLAQLPDAKDALIITDGFGPSGMPSSEVSNADVSTPPTTDAGRNVIRNMAFATTREKTMTLLDRHFGNDAIRSAGGSLQDIADIPFPEFVSEICTLPMLRKRRLIFFLDDVDHSGAPGAALPFLVHVLCRMSQTDNASVLVVATCGESPSLWRGLEGKPVWNDSWRLLPTLGPFTRPEVRAYCSQVFAPDRFPEDFFSAIYRSTRGVPRVLAETMRWLREMGDIYSENAVWNYRQSLPLEDAGAELNADANVSQAMARAVGLRLDKQEEPGSPQFLARAILDAAAIEGRRFTLEAVHRYLRPSSDFPNEFVDFDVFTRWVDRELVSGSDGRGSLRDICLLCGARRSTVGTTRYEFVSPAVRDYLWGGHLKRVQQDDAAKDAISRYANCLSQIYGRDNPHITLRVAELRQIAEDHAEIDPALSRAYWGTDPALIDSAMAAFRSGPTTDATLREIALMSVWRAGLGGGSNPDSRVRYWDEAVQAVREVNDGALEKEALSGMVAASAACGNQNSAFEMIEKAMGDGTDPDLLDLRGDCYCALGNYREAEHNYESAAARLEHFLRQSGTILLLDPERSKGPRSIERTQWASLHKYAALLNKMGQLSHHREKHAEAEQLLERSLGITERISGPEHREVAGNLNALAMLYYSQGRFADADLLFRRSLEIHEKVLGPEHEEVATSLNNLGQTSGRLGRYAEAERLLMRSLAIHEAFGPERIEVAICLNNLGQICGSLGKFFQAEQYLKRSLEIHERLLGPEHPGVAASLNNLGEIYGSLGRHAKAETILRRALAINEKALGPEHPGICPTLNNLGEVCRNLYKYSESELHLKRSLAINEKVLGPEQPEVAGDLNNLAMLYYSQGRFAEADSLFRRSLEIHEKVLGPEHPAVARTLSNLAMLLYLTQGRHADADVLFKRSFAIYDKVFGPDHPDVKALSENYAKFLLKQV